MGGFIPGGGGSGRIVVGNPLGGHGGGGYGDLPPMPSMPAPLPNQSNPAAPVTSTNTSEISPYLKKALGRLDERFSEDNTKRAIQDSNLGISDAAALSAADQKGGLSRRGLVGSEGGATFLSKNVYQPAQRQAAKAAADITLAQQARKDNLVLGSQGLVQAPDQINLANRAEASREQEAQAQQQMQQAQLQQQQQSQWLSLMGMS